MAGGVGSLIVILLLALWVWAFVKLQEFGSKGIVHFFVMLGAVILIGGFLFLVIVVPVMDCRGFLCGLDSLLLYIVCCLILLLVFPILMLTFSLRSFRRKQPEPQQEILEDI